MLPPPNAHLQPLQVQLRTGVHLIQRQMHLCLLGRRARSCQCRRQLLLQCRCRLHVVPGSGFPKLTQSQLQVWRRPRRLLLLLLLLAARCREIWLCNSSASGACCSPRLGMPVGHHSYRDMQALKHHLQLGIHWHSCQWRRRQWHCCFGVWLGRLAAGCCDRGCHSSALWRCLG